MERPEFTSKKMNRNWLIHSLYKGALKVIHKKKINSLHTTEFLEMFDIIIIIVIAIIKTVHKDVSQFLPVI